MIDAGVRYYKQSNTQRLGLLSSKNKDKNV